MVVVDSHFEKVHRDLRRCSENSQMFFECWRMEHIRTRMSRCLYDQLMCRGRCLTQCFWRVQQFFLQPSAFCKMNIHKNPSIFASRIFFIFIAFSKESKKRKKKVIKLNKIEFFVITKRFWFFFHSYKNWRCLSWKIVSCGTSPGRRDTKKLGRNSESSGCVLVRKIITCLCSRRWGTRYGFRGQSNW